MNRISVLMPARSEEFLQQTIDDIFKHAEGDIEVLVGLDGWYVDIPQRPRLKVFYYSDGLGQRGCTNALARQSDADYLMKCDAHLSFSQGFDKELLKLKDKATVIVPALCNLYAYDWVCDKGHKKPNEQFEDYKKCGQCGSENLKKEVVWRPIPNPIMTNYYFDTNLHFQYCEKQDTEHLQTETMSIQGSAFMISKKDYWDLGICDEKFGSWGQQGTEISAKIYLSGGKILSTRNAFYAHWFRKFPYQNPIDKILKAKEYSHDLFLNNKWDKQIYPFSYILEKFWPIQTWTEEDLTKQKKREMECERSGIYSILNKTTGRIYIGSAKNLKQRFNEHLRRLKRNDHENPYLQAIWNKYGEQDFSFDIKLFTDLDNLLIKEQEIMNDYKNKIGWRQMFNLNPNASSGFGRKHGLLSIAKMKNRTDRPFLGKKHSLESIEKMKKSHLGQLAWNKGKSWPQKIKEKISQANKGKKGWNKGLTKETDERVKKYSDKAKGRKQWLNHPHPKGMLGKHLSEKAKEIIGQKSKENAKKRQRLPNGTFI